MRFPTNAEKQQNQIAAHECPVTEKGEFRNSPIDKGGHLSPRLFGRKSNFHSLLMVSRERAARGPQLSQMELTVLLAEFCFNSMK